MEPQAASDFYKYLFQRIEAVKLRVYNTVIHDSNYDIVVLNEYNVTIKSQAVSKNILVLEQNSTGCFLKGTINSTSPPAGSTFCVTFENVRYRNAAETTIQEGTLHVYKTSSGVFGVFKGVSGAVSITQALRNKILAKLSPSQADNLIAELGTNPTLRTAMEAEEILPEVWKRIDDGIPSFKLDKPTDYLTAMKKMSVYEKAKGGSGTVKYYRVQGGGSGNSTSRELLEVSADGKLTFTDKTKELYFSTDNLDHANYYITGKGTNINGEILNVSPPRAGGEIIEFEVPKWLDDKLKAETIPQYKSGSNTLNNNSPQIVDYNQPGNPFGIKTNWQTLIEQNYIIGSAKVVN